MCGIAGVWWSQAPTALQVQQRIAASLHCMRYRGPDDDGRFIHQFGNGLLALLHKRLSVIDLSAGGHQPKTSSDGRYTIVFNGEIYNYKELRAQLKKQGRTFYSQSDTEVLLQAWIHWGSASLALIEGMFSFVVFDQEEKTLTAVRDAFGIKPLFYSHQDGNFIFASELPAVQALMAKPPALDWQRSYDYLVHGDYDSQDRTFLEGILQLPAGHLLVLDLKHNVKQGGNLSIRSWWQADLTEKPLSFADATEQLRAQFLDNIKLHLRSDVPLGAALSGGIDSSAVVCAMRYVQPDAPLHTFSFIAEPGPLSEEKWVDQVNQYVRAIPHKVYATGNELIRDIDEMIAAQGEPFGSTSIYAQYRVFQAARHSGITVTLDGQGADELLAGYIGYPGQRIASMLESGEWMLAWQFAKAWGTWPNRSTKQAFMHFLSAVLPSSLNQKARSFMGRTPEPEWLQLSALKERDVLMLLSWDNGVTGPKGRRVMGQLETALTTRGLPGLLRHGDRNSMHFSVESRVPFLTLPMANLCLSLPESHLISYAGETKSVFRAAMRGIVPDEILDRKDKIGFATPELAWLRQGALLFKEWLKAADDIPLLNGPVLREQFDEMLSGIRPFSWQAWRWVNFVRWYSLTFNPSNSTQNINTIASINSINRLNSLYPSDQDNFNTLL